MLTCRRASIMRWHGDVRTKIMAEVRGASLKEQRYQAILFSALAGLAILLAALGIYGFIAQSVAQRTREMGIRLALGATIEGVIRSAALPGITLAVAGVICGIVLALFVTRLLKTLIWALHRLIRQLSLSSRCC
jgi:putative ABC transport system permease protein